jgi:endonuclease-3 related protein
MSTERLGEAIRRLRLTCGKAESDAVAAVPRRFRTLVDVVAGTGSRTAEGPTVGQFDRPDELAELPVEVLKEALKQTGRDPRRATALQGLARWWPQDDPAKDWCNDHQRRREELTAVSGVGHELVDRILLLVLEVPTMPLSRAAIRVGCRHGWNGLESEYEEWQHLYQQAAEVAGESLSETDRLIRQVGQSHCGPRPKCDGCPLESLLPDAGPYEPE